MDEKEFIDQVLLNVRAYQIDRESIGAFAPKSAQDADYLDPSRIAKLMDNTLLKPESTHAQIRALCEEAKQYQFASVCVNSGHVRLCNAILEGSGVAICVVVGFPIGSSRTEVKVYEAECALQDGASEIDMVMNIGAIKSGDLALAAVDMYRVTQTVHRRRAVLKVIIETALLAKEEKVTACRIAKETGADFVKTCTGFAGGGATAEDIQLMRAAVGADMGVKASGGVRSLDKLLAMEQAGASRMGVTVGGKIMQELFERKRV